MYNGIINIYKEPGFTSHDVVAKTRGILKQKKVGHTGTLDPQASGVLPVCLGVGTKLCDMLAGRDKEYVATLLLGVETDTQDTAGNVLSRKPVEAGPEEVREAVLSFRGEYGQIPPMYSALKVNGRKLYELAREGREVERKPRQVVIHGIEILDMRLPQVDIRVTCSKGTYIRTLCHDIGRTLGCGGTMSSLLRTRVGSFFLEDAVTLGELEKLCAEGTVEGHILPVDGAFAHLPALHIRPEWGRLTANGNAFSPAQTAEGTVPGQGGGCQARVYGASGAFAGVYRYDTDRDEWRPVKMFLESGAR